eukprot:COSAG01_NODE_1573_length_9865_cov_132.568503_5_plen_103_part_00
MHHYVLMNAGQVLPQGRGGEPQLGRHGALPLLDGLAAAGLQEAVSRPFPSWNRSILAESHLCHACSCHEILRTETAGQDPEHPARVQAHEGRRMVGGPQQVR